MLVLLGELIGHSLSAGWVASRLEERSERVVSATLASVDVSLLRRALRVREAELVLDDSTRVSLRALDVAGVPIWNLLNGGRDVPRHAVVESVVVRRGDYEIAARHAEFDRGAETGALSGFALRPMPGARERLRPGTPTSYTMGIDRLEVAGLQILLAKTQPASPQTRAISAQTRPASPQTPAISAQTRPASPQTQAISAQTRYASPQTRAISAQTRPISDDDGVRASEVRVHGWTVSVYSDRRLAGPPQPVVLPHQMFREMDLPVHVDRVEMADGTVVYEEVPPDGDRAGRVEFGGLKGTLGPLDNRASDTLRVEAYTRINRGLPLGLEIAWPLASDSLEMSARAWTSAFLASVLNEMFEPNAGIRILGGNVDTLVTRFSVRSGSATGTLSATYDSLEVEAVDKRDTDDEKLLLSLLFDAKLDDRHLLGESVGEVQHDRAATETLFTFLWFTVRSGLMSLIGA